MELVHSFGSEVVVAVSVSLCWYGQMNSCRVNIFLVVKVVI